MNRKRRKKPKSSSVNTFTKEQIELAKLMTIRKLCAGRFKEGDSVKLNLALMRAHPGWDMKVAEYHQWCERHKDCVFTVEYDAKHVNNPELVCLAEDDTSAQWLFSVMDLVPADGDDGFTETISWITAGRK